MRAHDFALQPARILSLSRVDQSSFLTGRLVSAVSAIKLGYRFNGQKRIRKRF